MIEIRARFRPFSHRPGSICTIPCSPYVLEAFPTLIRMMSDGELYELRLGITGPVKEFTQIVDIENQAVQVFGTAVEGYFSLNIRHDESILKVSLSRGKAMSIQMNGEEIMISSETPIYLPVKKVSFHKKTSERLSLGSHKKLDWDLVTRRFSLIEILPVLYALGQGVTASTPLVKILSLDEIESLLASRFNGILTPMDRDVHHLGLGWTGPKTVGEYPTDLLRYCYESIRSFFFEEGKSVSILPAIPKEFPSGRLIGIEMDSLRIDVEWTKKKIRKVNLFAKEEVTQGFTFDQRVKRCRIRRSTKEKGCMIDVSKPLKLKKGVRYFLDKFET